MAPCISDISLTQLSAFIAAHMGLHFPRERWRDLEREISSVAREGDATALALLARLYANQSKSCR
jgi:chemotaxis protein methyltransferase CheR